MSHSDQKENIHEFNDENSKDAFMDWILVVQSVFDYKQYHRHKRVLT